MHVFFLPFLADAFLILWLNPENRQRFDFKRLSFKRGGTLEGRPGFKFTLEGIWDQLPCANGREVENK